MMLTGFMVEMYGVIPLGSHKPLNFSQLQSFPSSCMMFHDE